MHTFVVDLLMAWQPTVIKGNAGELAAIANSLEVNYLYSGNTCCIELLLQVQAKGVDSVGQGFADPAKFVRDLARKRRTTQHFVCQKPHADHGNVSQAASLC